MFQIPEYVKAWINDDQYRQFQQENMGRHLSEKDGKFLKAVQKMLTQLEKDAAKETHRAAAKITVNIDSRGPIKDLQSPAVIGQDFWGRPVYDPQRTFYIPKANRYNFGIAPGKNGLQLLCQFYHEAEHATQHKGVIYNHTQKQLIAIAATLYSQHALGESTERTRQVDIEYRNNYQELFAHMAEAKLCIAAYQELLQTNPEQLIQDKTILVFDDVAQRLLTGVSLDNALAMNERNIHTLLCEPVDTELLRQYFTGETDKEICQNAAKFLQTTAPALYALAMDKAQELGRVLRNMIQEMRQEQQAIQQAALREQQLKTQQMVLSYAKACNIPVLYQTPENAPYGCQALYPSTIQDLLVHSTFTQHSRVIVMEEGKTPQLMYDHRPIPRPYSTNPALRAQWEAEHPEEQDADMKIYTRDADEPR